MMMNELLVLQICLYPVLTHAVQQRPGKGTREAAAAVVVAILMANQQRRGSR